VACAVSRASSAAAATVLHQLFNFDDTEIEHRKGRQPLADFSNTEEFNLLVIEDDFPNGLPRFEDAGVLFTDRSTVERIERMKVGACLNPLHTAVAVFGCLLGFSSIAVECADPDIKAFIRLLAENELLPAVDHPGIIDPQSFLRDVLERRQPNPGIPDTPQRIATDTSQKISARFAGAIRFALAHDDAAPLTLVPLVIAAWLRYLIGIDDLGIAFPLSPDPRATELSERLRSIRPDDPQSVWEALEPILADETIFGLDLTQTPVAGSIARHLAGMLAGPGSVRSSLHDAVTAPHLENEPE